MDAIKTSARRGGPGADGTEQAATSEILQKITAESNIGGGDYGGWDSYGEYLAWFEREVMGFDSEAAQKEVSHG